MSATRCIDRARHWRVVRGTVGIRSPVCVVCGSPNPRPLSADEWAELIDWAQHYNVGARVRAAISERQAS
jgi:hypothetical protein